LGQLAKLRRLYSCNQSMDAYCHFSPFAGIATVTEVVFGIFLLIGFKTEVIAKLSGVLLLIFAFSMSFSIWVKSGYEYSVFTASAAFGLSLLKEKWLEVDSKHVKNSYLNTGF